jgi:hypothetical protein
MVANRMADLWHVANGYCRICGSRKLKRRGEGLGDRCRFPGGSLPLSADCEQANPRFCQKMALYVTCAHVGGVDQNKFEKLCDRV